ncbi:MAG: bifunctional diaminohydroxyphosphoribosylaminopyrimidine deaminase/5-amino-6-(5-phosphoribosylamino)uracil reductase RibD [Gemmatimonadales bacterium]
MDEREAMSRALDLAWKGWGRVQPNPLVGAVLLRDGNVVAEGWHAEFGGAHAEAAALAAAGEAARGATAVVTLEPCTHQGKQPPCTEALIAAGVRRVVAAMADPNPVAAGGAARLRAAGVEVEIGLLERAAAAQNAIFLHHLREPARPFVALKLATTIDGRIADANGNSRWISGAEARGFVHWLRAGFDAIGVGGVTARTDDPSLTVRGPLQPQTSPLRIVFAADGDIPPALTVVRTARETPTVAIVAPGASSSILAPAEAAGVEVIRSADLLSALRTLRTRGVDSLLVEGGGRLAGALLAAGLVDRYYWVQSPLWLGMGAVPATAGLPGSALGEATRWSVSERRALGEDTLLVLDRI